MPRLRLSWLSKRAIVCATASLVLALTSAPARAEPSPADRAAAEALFRDARKLMKKREYASACRKLEESQRLDPQGGTLLNLAVCHAREGRTASAWVEFQEASEIAKNAKRRDRVLLAERELKKLEKKLSRLTIEVPPESRLPGLVLHRGMETVGEGAWGTAVPVDPDIELALEAEAPGHRPWKLTVVVHPEEQKTVVIPKLEKLPPPKPKPKQKSRSELQAERRARERESQRLIAYIAGGTGLVAIGVGSYFGLTAMSKQNDAEDHCNGSLCNPEGLELSQQANRAATVSNVAFGIGAIGLAVGGYFYVISLPPSREKRTSTAQRSPKLEVLPSITTESGAILMTGRW